MRITERKPRLYLKKAAEPLSTILIASGVFVIGSVATGVLNKLGSDAWDGLKKSLSKYFGRKQQRERLLEFSLLVEHAGKQFEVLILLENPDDRDVTELLDERFFDLDAIVNDVAAKYPEIARLTLVVRDKKLRLLYVLRPDAYPLEVDWELVPCTKQPEVTPRSTSIKLPQHPSDVLGLHPDLLTRFRTPQMIKPVTEKRNKKKRRK